MGNKSFVFRFADVEVREREFTIIKAGKALAVEPKAFRALLFLLRNPQKLITKEELLNSVWGDVAVAEGSLTRCIWLLRRVLGDDINQPRYIATIATVGYRLSARSKFRRMVGKNPRRPASPRFRAILKRRSTTGNGLWPGYWPAAFSLFAWQERSGTCIARCRR